jgi:hypothetical protein
MKVTMKDLIIAPTESTTSHTKAEKKQHPWSKISRPQATTYLITPSGILHKHTRIPTTTTTWRLTLNRTTR